MTVNDLHYRLAKATLCMVLVVVIPQHVAAVYPEYLGCFQDSADQADVAGIVMTYPQADVLDCTARCLLEGYPYVGVQNGTFCYCGHTYGRYGISSDCKEDCEGRECGGPLANDVYYTVATGFEVWKSRALAVHNRSTTFWQARVACINEGGDLASLSNSREVEEAIKLAIAKDIRSSVWFGLWQRQEKTKFVYEWTNVESNKFTPQALTPYSTESNLDEHSQRCAQLSLTNNTVYFTNCTDYRPFICFQPSLPGAANDDETETPTETPDTGPSMLAFYIVMPFFVLCYGGSCFVYCVHKTFRQCRRRHHRRVAVGSSVDAFSEMSKERPPSWIAAAPPTTHPGEYKHRDASSDTSNRSSSQRVTERLGRTQQLIVTTSEENEIMHSRSGKTQKRIRTRMNGSVESLTDIRIRQEEVTTKRTDRKRRRENPIKSRLLAIEDVLEQKKEFGKERRGKRKILIA